MSNGRFAAPIILYLALFLFIAPHSQAQASDCETVTAVSPSECNALQALYQATDGANWVNNTGWLTFSTPNAPCDWYGVVCAAGSVSELRLSANGLNGTIPRTIQFLPALTRLELANNQLRGTVPRTICALTDSVTSADFAYNALFSHKRVTRACLDRLDPDWLATQTIDPQNVAITQFSPTSLTLSWLPIPYQGDGGYYEIATSPTPSGPFTVHGQTADKQATSYTVTGLEPGTTTHVRVRTITPAHGDQPSELRSPSTRVVGVTEAPGNSVLLLAYFPADNDLSGYIGTLIARLRDGSANNPNVQVVLLVDGLGEDNTRLLTIAKGEVTVTTAVFDQFGTHELDTSSPDTLAWFLSYGRSQFPASLEIVSLLGHGLALAPEAEWSNSGLQPTGPNDPIPPLPQGVDATPGDVTSRTYLSTIDIGQALAAATDNGANPFDILFFDQCFQGSLDALYESRTAADIFIASPNYAWFAAAYDTYLPQLAPATTPAQMAQAIIDRYQGSLNNEHPNTIFWLSRQQIETIAAKVSGLGVALQTAVSQNNDAPILQATQASQFVDTNQCDGQQFELAPPDELIGAGSFATALQQRFPAGDPAGVHAAAGELLAELDTIASRSRIGSPHIAPDQQWAYRDTVTILAPLRRTAAAADVWRASVYREEAGLTAVWTLDPAVTATLHHPFAFAVDGQWDDFLADWYTGTMEPTVGHWCHFVPPTNLLAEDSETLLLAATTLSPTSVTLAWEPTSDDTATAYWLFVNGPDTVNWVLYDGVGLAETAVTLSNLLPNATYRFRITAADSHGTLVAASEEVVWSAQHHIYLPLLGH